MGENLTWVGPDGVSTLVVPSGLQLHRESGTQGRFMPPIDYSERESVSGVYLQNIQAKPREINIPVFVINEADAVVVRSSMRQLARLFNPLYKDGLGKLQYTTPDGTVREINCAYVGGMEATDDDGYYHRFVLTFRAFDPFWYSISDTVISYTLGAVLVNFFPFFPLRLSGSTLVSLSTDITNPGDVDSWPVWTIQGPGDTLILRNNTTGLSMSVALNLTYSQRVVIDTRPFKKTIVDGVGNNLYPLLSPTSDLWPLAAGLNSAYVELNNSSSDTIVNLAYRPRYLTA